MSGKKSDAEKQLNEVYAMNAQWPKLWFRPADAPPASLEATSKAESSEKAPILGANVPPLETLAIDEDISAEEAEGRGSITELFGPAYWYVFARAFTDAFSSSSHIETPSRMLCSVRAAGLRCFSICSSFASTSLIWGRFCSPLS